jgi:16S rRNA (uracil1498-N3)-methyltransferase
MTEAKIRLYVDHPLGPGQPVPLLPAQAHYLFNVMRAGPGHAVLVFNGQDGEWLAEVASTAKRDPNLRCMAQTRPLMQPPDLWLIFAPLKKSRTDYVVEKAVELGVARIQPVQTRFTNADRLREDKLVAHAVEAAEQCGATVVPKVGALVALQHLLASWQPERHLLWCDEALAGAPARVDPASGRGEPWAILIGPEGGFSTEERIRISALPSVTSLSLGPRILRADTAAVAAMTLWQAALGDWQ